MVGPPSVDGERMGAVCFRITSPLDKMVSPGVHSGPPVHARRVYISRFSFRRPQCVFEGPASGIGFAPCSANIIPTCACMSGPRSSAAIITASPAACHSGLCCSEAGNFNDVRRGVFQRDDRPSLRWLDRIVEGAGPGHGTLIVDLGYATFTAAFLAWRSVDFSAGKGGLFDCRNAAAVTCRTMPFEQFLRQSFHLQSCSK